MTQQTIDALDVGLFDEPPPVRAPMAPAAPAGLITTTCAVCSARYNAPLEWNGRLCANCRADLPATRAHVEALMAAVERRRDANNAAWAAEVEALPDDLAARWTAAFQARTAAERALARATTGPMYRRSTQERVDIEAAARADLEAWREKFARTAANPENPLCAIARAEQAFEARRAQLRAEVELWQRALDEITCAEDDSPF